MASPSPTTDDGDDRKVVRSSSQGKLKVRKRRHHHKSRTGCTACKKRREKCDEKRPICSSCIRLSTECTFAFLKPALPTAQSSSNVSARAFLPPVPSPPSLSVYKNMIRGVSSEEDLRYFHHFVTKVTNMTGVIPYLSHQALSIAYEYPFLMQGVLSIAAIHLSHLHPEHEEGHLLSATKYQQMALPVYRSLLATMNKDNYQAVIAFSKVFTWTSVAAPQIWPGLVDEKSKNWLPVWFVFMRASSLLVRKAEAWIKEKDCPYAILFGLYNMPLKHIDHPDDFRILHLISRLPLMVSPDDEDDDLRVNLEVCLNLRDAFFRAADKDLPYAERYAMNEFLSSCPQRYVDMLVNCNPRSLIIAAHLCALGARAESIWFLKGTGIRLLTSIMERLSPEWHDFVRWPCEIVGYKLA